MKKYKVILVSSMLAFALILGACGKKGNDGKVTENKKVEENKEKADKDKAAKEDNKGVALSVWEGKWVNYASFVDTDEVKAVFKGMDKGEEFKANLIKKNDVGFNRMEVQGNTIKFLDQAKDGKIISESEYEFVKDHKGQHGKTEINWHEFKAKDEKAKFPTLLLLEPHGEEVMLHYHFKAGSGDAAAMLADKSVLTGTFVKEDINPAQIANGIKMHMESQKKKAEEGGKAAMKAELKDWNGEWNNIEGYLDKPEVMKALEEKAKKEGKKLEDIKKEFTDSRHLPFKGLKVDGDSLTLYDGFISESGKEMAKLNYKYVESHSVKHGNSELFWHVFETKDNEEYKYVLMMPVHGEEEIVHFHMRYGKDIKELLGKEDWYPTMVSPSSTMDQVVTEVSE